MVDEYYLPDIYTLSIFTKLLENWLKFELHTFSVKVTPSHGHFAIILVTISKYLKRYIVID